MSRDRPPPNARHNPVPLPKTDLDRQSIERAAFNFRRDFGAPMRLPPTLYLHLRSAGVNVRDMLPDESLELVDPRKDYSLKGPSQP